VKIVYFAIGLAFATAAAHAESGRFAGFAVWYKGNASDYVIERGGQEIAMGYYRHVYSGDVIMLRKNDDMLRLNLTDGREIVITSKNTPYVVPRSSRWSWPVTLENTLDALGEYLTKEQERPVSLLSRGGPPVLAIPGLEDGSACVGAGARIFGVSWHDGITPFTVTLTDSSGRELVRESGVMEQGLRVRSRKIDLLSGNYTITVRDGRDKEATGHFTAVAPNAIPQPDPERVPDFLDPSAKSVVAASWLVDNNERRTYSYEAYLDVLPFVEDGNDASLEKRLLLAQ
jgi:hypothetical protein